MKADVLEKLRAPDRVAALRRLELVGTPAEESFDRLTRLVRRLLKASSALVVLVEEEEQFFKSCVGVPEPWASTRRYPASQSLCQFVVATGEPLVLEDAREHPLLSRQRVLVDLEIVAYVGIPLVTSDGHILGTFCVCDSKARKWTDEEIELLQDLAAAAMTEIELQAMAREAKRQRQEAERQRREAEREHREKIAILESITDGFFALDRSWRFIYVNKRVEQLTQMSWEELLGANIWEKFPEAIETKIYEEYHRAFREQVTVEFEEYYPPYNKWFQLHAYPSEQGLSVYYQDITERKRIESLLAGQMQILEAVASGMPLPKVLDNLVRMIESQSDGMLGGLLLLDESGRYLKHGAGPSLPESYSRALDGILVDPTVGPCAAAAFRREQVILENIEGCLWENFAQLALGHGLRACWSTPIVSPGGQLLGTFAMYYREPRAPSEWDRHLIEITTHLAGIAIERDRTEASLHFLSQASTLLSASLNFEETLQNVAQFIVPHFADWCVVDIVDEANALHRVAIAAATPEQTRWLEELQRRYPPDWDSPQPAVRALRAGQTLLIPRMDEEQIRKHSRDEEHVKIIKELDPRTAIAAPLITRGRTVGVITLARTGTCQFYGEADLVLARELANRAAIAVDNARLYREAQEALRIRDQFLSVAAHELKTPITSLIGYAQLLERRTQQEGATGERQQRYIRALSAQANRLHRLSISLLDLSRIQGGLFTIERKPVDLVPLLSHVAEDLQLTVERHQILVKQEAPSLLIEGDELRLEQAVYNLIQNAIKYSPEGGLIQVRAWQEGEQALIAVRDQGIGIPAEALPRLFSRFYRAKNVEFQHIAGMGLGLFVVKEIVALHGGRIEVESREGEGSTFTIRLPLAGAQVSRLAPLPAGQEG